MSNLDENIGLFDLDDTLVDYSGAIGRDLASIAGPNDPPYSPWGENAQFIRGRIIFIRNQPGWWRSLEVLQAGFDVLKVARELEFTIHILTKGPIFATPSWTEKVEWVMRHVPDAGVTVTQEKRLVYGKFLVDDYPGYISEWLAHRPRGLVIMPVYEYNRGFSHPNLVKYDGSNLAEVRRVLEIAKMRRPNEELRLT